MLSAQVEQRGQQLQEYYDSQFTGGAAAAPRERAGAGDVRECSTTARLSPPGLPQPRDAERSMRPPCRAGGPGARE